MAAHIDDPGSGFLGLEAERLASLAVRTGRREHLERALLAIALAAQGTADWRDVLVVTPLPWDAAQRIGLDPAPLYEEVAAIAPQQGAAFLREFVQRRDENKTIEVMGYTTEEGAEGFRYVRTW